MFHLCDRHRPRNHKSVGPSTEMYDGEARLFHIRPDEFSLIRCCLVGAKTCRHAAPFWNSLGLPGLRGAETGLKKIPHPCKSKKATNKPQEGMRRGSLRQQQYHLYLISRSGINSFSASSGRLELSVGYVSAAKFINVGFMQSLSFQAQTEMF